MTESVSVSLSSAWKLAKSLADRNGHVSIQKLSEALAGGFNLSEDSANVIFKELWDAGHIGPVSSYTVSVAGVRIAAPKVEPRIAASWDETFMQMALVVANRSKDPSTQVGACLVSEDNRILSLGYNGTPNGWDDASFPWGKTGDDGLETKYPFVIHAERNAVLNHSGLNSQLRGSRVYVTHFPCNECAKELAQVGVSEVVYLNSYDGSEFSIQASLKLFKACGIEVRQLWIDAQF